MPAHCRYPSSFTSAFQAPPPPPPEDIGQFSGLTVFNEGTGYVLPRVQRLLSADRARYADVCGEDVHRILYLLDWQATNAPVCVTAVEGNDVVAAAWAGRILTREDGTPGVNLSFAVDPDFEGRGLATVLTALAFAKCVGRHANLAFANIQTAAANGGAHALAERLAMDRAPEFDRIVPPPRMKCYVTFRAPLEQVAASCHRVIARAFGEDNTEAVAVDQDQDENQAARL